MQKLFNAPVKGTGRDRPNASSVLVLAVLWSLLSVFSGCSRVQVSGYDDSPDGKYRLFVDKAGAAGRPYYANTTKDVYIAIHAKDGNWSELLKQHYRLRGSDVGWNCTWDKQDKVTVVLFDYGIDVSHYDLKEADPPKRIIRKVQYQVNPKTRRFEEQNTK